MKRIAVTGSGGQIAYSLLFRIANGDLLGNEKIALHLLDLPEVAPSLQGVKMELEDCAFPFLKEIRISTSPEEAFEGVDYAFLVGAKPRGPGMERKDLLHDNGKIFSVQGKALNRTASRDVKVLVVGNPSNTNCLIAMHNAPDLKKSHFYSMMRLDQNRAASMLAAKAGVGIEAVSHVTVWGNHSSTQVADFLNAKINGRPAKSVIQDEKWLREEFIPLVQKRGAAVIAARGKSSAASAANAAIDAMRDIVRGADWYSSGIYSNGNPYGIANDLVFSFPCKGHGEIIKGVELDSFLQEKIAITQKELMEERDQVRGLLK